MTSFLVVLLVFSIVAHFDFFGALLFYMIIVLPFFGTMFIDKVFWAEDNKKALAKIKKEEKELEKLNNEMNSY